MGHLTKAAAYAVSDSSKPLLRFGKGDSVACRVRNSQEDGLEQWLTGEVSLLWPALPACALHQHACDEPSCGTCEEMTDELPSTVPYRIDLKAGGSVYCHRDHHTLIRKNGMQPRERVRGISKRM